MVQLVHLYGGSCFTYTIGLINTSYNIGGIVSGFFFGGPIADKLGRRWGMGIGCFLTIIATFLQCFSPRGNLNAFIGGRVIIGLGQGIALTAGPVYIGELAPSSIRGKIMGFWQLFIQSVLFLLIGLLTRLENILLLSENGNGKQSSSSKCSFQSSSVFFYHLSPRLRVGTFNAEIMFEAARQSLRAVRDTEQEVEDELLQIREALEYEREQKSTSSYKALWMDNYSSAIYKGIYKNAETINLINAINGTCGILFTLNAVWTVDRYGRKFLFIVGGFGMALCMIAFASVGVATPNSYYMSGTTKTLTKDQPVGIALTFLLFLFIFFYKPTWGATTWIWTSEVFSMNVRAQAFFPVFLAKCSFKTFYFFSGINCLLVLFVLFIVPETRNVMLEEMDVLFGGVNHVEKGGAQLGLEDLHHAYARHVEVGKEIEGVYSVEAENVRVGEKV
ncbi:hypothetical protein DID88_004357 [Monilinia fructigena]|uniref:Major facilitator superfamily (MFS) profile domain-containing protein n=1 Tax=Monilinia fructigena TaxID=38457 RepID=A0A395IT03_9HELO|nr:hypothetical protein DID88_004357 [Monilinia fructigena]